jgi:hypothetical protein
VACSCNPSYSGGRDQFEAISKKPFTKIVLVEWLKVKALSSNPSTAKQKQKQKTKHQAKRREKLLPTPATWVIGWKSECASEVGSRCTEEGLVPITP